MLALRNAPARYLLLTGGLWLTVFFFSRSLLLLTHWPEANASAGDVLRLFGIGLLYDLAFLSYALLPLGLYLALCPPRLWQRRGHQLWLQGLLGATVFVMLFSAVAEWLFWDEFGVRFNFIAVDYLVYSDEVIQNIRESYPVGSLLTLLALLSAALTWSLRKPLQAILQAPAASRSARLGSIALLAGMATAALLLLDQEMPRGQGGNTYQHELASNGPYQFFAAFRNNELDYDQFYSSLPAEDAGRQLRAELAEPNSRFLSTDPLDIRRKIDNPGQPRPLNIVLVTIESLSAKYLGSFGDNRGLTPNLDQLRRESLAFTNFYATGTRTDRGLEAITLAIPPTPGRSIVKRIGRENGYASLGQQLSAKGYDSVFVYGGRSYFDNMGAFFGGNGYRVVDQSSVDESDIHFKNAWGMADEDLYNQTLKLADADHAAGKPFLLQLMTTSNHRPYTYPEGRIDIASGDGREGAVKYTDWAIGDFLAKARQKPWFNDTLFVFVADHCAGSAGSEDLPVANYHIPLFIYAPQQIAAREDAQLASQIDLAPTLLGLLNQDYVSTFYGRNLLQANQLPARVLIGNYQHLGLFDGKDLAILSPRQGMRRHDDALGQSIERRVDRSDPLLQRDIGYFQAASHAFRQHLLGWQGSQPDQRVTQHCPVNQPQCAKARS
ncbi:phosphoglycerol transferase MdoB-like AlkP superfamily enzyme [Pseudomonas fluvialis]|uniref:Phosphoglycerol transferase MdoB-like AlkP superfamily enzyme n=1 Tax=Pseudomonas fluvialis TaxID=1793966 RepID=A0A7X0BRC7_9PSED|nr:LTA synthase family protein [Pseudomonas fluvialis]MBB6341484.1 phosphoglycerol transferase MdoB-like AlkP superfamily enzyme [Pseudomonas fluvialis]